MIDNDILLAFFDSSKPCPASIKNCHDLRKLYEHDKEKIIQKGCTTCTIANFNDHFIKHVLYKNYFKTLTISSKNIAKQSKNVKTKKEEFYNFERVILPLNLIYKGETMQESLYVGKNFLYVVSKYYNENEYVKIHFKLKFLNFRFLIVGKSKYTYKYKFKILFYNKKSKQLYYITK
jgi:hypothetical protein